jgi:hypothetical protein
MFTTRRAPMIGAMAVVTLLSFARPGLCDPESFSYYSDLSISSDASSVYGTITGADYSDCSHSGYWSTIWVTGPNGGQNTWGWDWGFVGPDVSLPYEGDGNYAVNSDTFIYSCSCGGEHDGGGGSDTTQVNHFLTHYDFTAMGNPNTYTLNSDSQGIACARPTMTWGQTSLSGMTNDGLYMHFGAEPIACVALCSQGKTGAVSGPLGPGAPSGPCLP